MDQSSMPSIKKQEPDICRNRHGGVETSVEADKTVKKQQDRELIYGYIQAARHYGHTLDELSVLLNRPPNSISGRLTELKVQGKIVYTGRKRQTRSGCLARVYTIPVY